MNSIIKIKSTLPSCYDINEAFKTLRTNLFFAGEDIKVIALTSADPDEGKSTVSLELAKSISQVDKKVLYIDADLRKSGFAEKLVSSGSIKGLSHYLSSPTRMADVIYPTQYPYLHVICSGPFPPNPVELLDSAKFRNLISECRNVYDYVIIDTPPIGSVVDAAVISNTSDGVVLVTKSGAISPKYAREVIARLKKNKTCKIIGAILNNVEVSYKDYYYRRDKNYYTSDGNGTHNIYDNIDIPTEKQFKE